MGQNPSEKTPEKKTDPWGREIKKVEGPPELDVLIGKLKIKLIEILGKKNSSNPNLPSHNGTSPPAGLLIGFITGLLLLIWALSGIFIVSPAERAVVTRFGKYIATVEPGPHWMPRFVDAVQIVDIQRVSNYTYESEMLTKDENIVSVAVAVQYRINDAKDFLFNVVDPVRGLQQATASALRQTVGHNALDELLTTGRTEVREQATAQLQEILSNYKSGIVVTNMTLQSIKPPEDVVAAFDDAIKAREDEQAYIDKASAYANQIIADAKGRIARILQEADAYKQEVVLDAQASVADYLALLPAYMLSPQLMRQRLYLSTMESIFNQTPKVLLNQKNSNPLIYLPLDKLNTSNTIASKTEPDNALTPTAMPPVTTNITNEPAKMMNLNSGAFLGRPTYPSTTEDNK